MKNIWNKLKKTRPKTSFQEMKKTMFFYKTIVVYPGSDFPHKKGGVGKIGRAGYHENHMLCQTSVNLTPYRIKHTSRSWFSGTKLDMCRSIILLTHYSLVLLINAPVKSSENLNLKKRDGWVIQGVFIKYGLRTPLPTMCNPQNYTKVKFIF